MFSGTSASASVAAAIATLIRAACHDEKVRSRKVVGRFTGSSPILETAQGLRTRNQIR